LDQTHPDPDPDPDTDSYPEPDSDSYPEPDSDSYPEPDFNSYPDSDSDPHSNPVSLSHCHSDSDRDCDSPFHSRAPFYFSSGSDPRKFHIISAPGFSKNSRNRHLERSIGRIPNDLSVLSRWVSLLL
jgi:hypothetical protein